MMMELEKDLLALVEKTANSLDMTSKEFVHQAIGMHLAFHACTPEQKLLIMRLTDEALR